MGLEKRKTIRQRMEELLRQMPHTCLDLGKALGLSVRDTAHHLEHLKKSLKARKKELSVTPAECRACGYAFVDRKRLTTPGKCPKCRSQRIEPPLFETD